MLPLPWLVPSLCWQFFEGTPLGSRKNLLVLPCMLVWVARLLVFMFLLSKTDILSLQSLAKMWVS
jgi:hypothetical protein